MRDARTAARLEVIEPLRIVSARRYGARLRIAVNHPRQRAHAIVFRFPSSRLARLYYARAMDWMRDHTEIAYVRGAEECALVDVSALFARLAQ